MKRVNHLYEKLISDENLRLAIKEVNRTHRWNPHHTPNTCTLWVEATLEDRVRDLRRAIEQGFVPRPAQVVERWDSNAQKTRTISMPKQWPDQYIHHALVQVLQPVCMRGMDKYCCGSIRERGIHYGKKAIEKWMAKDKGGTKYCLSMDIRHFYDSLKPEQVMARFRNLVKDRRTLDLLERIIHDGIKVGYYTSQWIANTFLQPLDVLIRGDEACHHYVRYMDNITIFGSNKRKLHRLKKKIEAWLNAHGLEVKGDWQVFPTKSRMPDALGYRYGRGYTLLRKRSLLKIKRYVARWRKRMRESREISLKLAAGLLSRIGQLKHCNNVHIYERLFQGQRIQHCLKRVVRQAA